jgi:Adenylate and Guanylate cyclase catalytic domain
LIRAGSIVSWSYHPFPLSSSSGIHSGSVTAGVLRGERARFQLFGDTMNTASRMESSGIPGRIQLSQETADLLTAAGKSSWLIPRHDVVVAKGKGEMQTYWLNVGSSNKSSSVVSGSSSGDEFGVLHSDRKGSRGGSGGGSGAVEKTSRLIQWNVEILMTLLKLIEARREDEMTLPPPLKENEMSSCTVLEEVKEIIRLPHLPSRQLRDPDAIQFPKEVEEELVQ